MHSSTETSTTSLIESGSLLAAAGSPTSTTAVNYAEYRVIRRNGSVVGFEPSKIAIAMTKAFLAVNGGQGAASARVRELVEQLTATVVAALVRRQPTGGTFHIEDIQDQVELALMRSGEHDVARAYVLYRAKHQEERRLQREAQQASQAQLPKIHVLIDGQRVVLEIEKSTRPDYCCLRWPGQVGGC